MSCWHMASVDCNLRKTSSVLSVIVPRLPRLPIFEGKFIKPFNSLFRSPHQPDRVNVSQVSLLDFQRLINVFRFDLHAIASVAGSNDSISAVWRVSGWLRDVSTSQVSRFAFLCYFGVDMLNLDVYRLDLDLNRSTAGSNDPIQTFGFVLAWLHGVCAS